MLNKTLSLFSWNVRGLGQSCRCDDVLAELISSRPTFACLQETKLAQVTPAKRKTFLPVRMSSFAARPSAGAAGGILTAWDANSCTVTDTLERPYSLTVFVMLAADGTTLHLTNIYAPTVSAEKSVFLAELAEIAGHVTGPWIIIVILILPALQKTRTRMLSTTRKLSFLTLSSMNWPSLSSL